MKSTPATARLPRRGLPEVPFAFLVLIVSGLAALLLQRFLDHADRPEYLIPGYALPIVFGVSVLMNLAVIAGFLSGRSIVSGLEFLATLLLFYGVLFNIVGLPLLALGALVAVGVVRLRGVGGFRGLIAVASGVTIALGLAFLIMVGTHPPLIDCKSGSGSATYWFWGGGPSTASGSAQIDAKGTLRGSEHVFGQTYEWECREGQLLDFHRSG